MRNSTLEVRFHLEDRKANIDYLHFTTLICPARGRI